MVYVSQANVLMTFFAFMINLLFNTYTYQLICSNLQYYRYCEYEHAGKKMKQGKWGKAASHFRLQKHSLSLRRQYFLYDNRNHHWSCYMHWSHVIITQMYSFGQIMSLWNNVSSIYLNRYIFKMDQIEGWYSEKVLSSISSDSMEKQFATSLKNPISTWNLIIWILQ